MRGKFAIAISLILILLVPASFDILQPPLTHQSIEHTDCIDAEDIVHEYKFKFFISGMELDSEYYTSPDCEIPIVTKRNNNLNVALDSVRFLSLPELFEIMDITYSSNQFYGIDVQGDTLSDCQVLDSWCKLPVLEMTQEGLDTSSCMNCHSGNRQSFFLGDAIREEFRIMPAMYLQIVIKDVHLPSDEPKLYSQFNWPHGTPYWSPDIPYGVSFLPHYFKSINNISIVYQKFNSVDVVEKSAYNFSSAAPSSNVTMGEYELSQVTFNELSSSSILNPLTHSKYLFYEMYDIQVNGSNHCRFHLFYQTSSDQEGVDERETINDWTKEGNCGNMVSMSPNEKFVYFGTAREKYVFEIGTNSISNIEFENDASPNSVTWIPTKDEMIMLNPSGSGYLEKINASTGESQTIVDSLDDLGIYEYTAHIRMSNFLGKNKLMILDDQHASQSYWEPLEFVFNDDFTNYSVQTIEPVYSSSRPYFDYQTNSWKAGSMPIFFGNKENFEHLIIDSDTSTVSLFRKSPMRVCFSVDRTWSGNGLEGDYQFDYDNDFAADFCDFDQDNDGIKSWYDKCPMQVMLMRKLGPDDYSDGLSDLNDDGCFHVDDGDMDLDGVSGMIQRTGTPADLCENGLRSWTTYRILGLYPYDNDEDGCHDLIEDDDDDNDGVLDFDDACPLRSNGHIDLDMDGLCEGDDEDDDGDLYSDLDEAICGSNSSDSESIPSDVDSDYLCDDVDLDVDGDNVTNEEDAFPRDVNEWNDLDNDGFGNNSDDCIGNYGTSTLDRLGCLDQDGDGVSDLNDEFPFDNTKGGEKYSNDNPPYFTYAGIIIAGLGLIIFVYRIFPRSSEEDDEEEYDEYKEISEVFSSQGSVNNTTESPHIKSPSFHLTGETHESGYEIIEYPRNSEQWWWKDTENECWMIWD